MVEDHDKSFFVYGFAQEQEDIKLGKVCKPKVVLLGGLATKCIPKDSIEEFICNNINGTGLNADDLHNFCTDYLALESSGKLNTKEIKELLEA